MIPHHIWPSATAPPQKHSTPSFPAEVYALCPTPHLALRGLLLLLRGAVPDYTPGAPPTSGLQVRKGACQSGETLLRTSPAAPPRPKRQLSRGSSYSSGAQYQIRHLGLLLLLGAVPDPTPGAPPTSVPKCHFPLILRGPARPGNALRI